MTKTDSFEIGKLRDNGQRLKVGEGQPGKSEVVIAWLFIVVMVILTVVAGYLLLEKVAY